MSKGRKIGRRAACATVLGIGGGLLFAGDASAARRASRGGAAAAALEQRRLLRRPGQVQARGRQRGLSPFPRSGRVPHLPNGFARKCGSSDFGLGHFTEVGLAGMFWVNNQKDNYASLEIFLLPGQMIPEHWHVALPAENVPVKMESWHVRWGSTYTYGEGEPTAKLGVKIPECEEKYVTVRHEKVLKLGEVAGLDPARAEALAAGRARGRDRHRDLDVPQRRRRAVHRPADQVLMRVIDDPEHLPRGVRDTSPKRKGG